MLSDSEDLARIFVTPCTDCLANDVAAPPRGTVYCSKERSTVARYSVLLQGLVVVRKSSTREGVGVIRLTREGPRKGAKSFAGETDENSLPYSIYSLNHDIRVPFLFHQSAYPGVRAIILVRRILADDRTPRLYHTGAIVYRVGDTSLLVTARGDRNPSQYLEYSHARYR